MYSALNMRGEIHTYGRLSHFLVLGTQNLPDSTMPKQASINAFYYVMQCSFGGDFSRTLPTHNPQRESLRLQNYNKKMTHANKIAKKCEILTENLCMSKKSSISARPFPSSALYTPHTQGGFPPNLCSRPAAHMPTKHFFAIRSFRRF